MEIIVVFLFVKDDEEQIETWHDRRRDVNVESERLGTVISSSERVGGGEDRGTRIKSGVDASLSNWNSLLLHGLVNSYLILDVHLIKLIDTANSVICKHQGTCFNAKLSCFGILTHRRGQTSSIWGLTTTVNCTGQKLADVLEELRLGCCRISNDANIQITSELYSICSVFFNTTKELEENSFFHIKMTPNTGCNRFSQLCVEIFLILHEDNCVLLLLSELVKVLFFLFSFIIVIIHLLEREAGVRREIWTGEENHLETQILHTGTIEARKAVHGTICTILTLHSVSVHIWALLTLARFHQLDNIWHNDKSSGEDCAITWLCLVNCVATKNYIDRTWHGACWNVSRELLQSQFLPVHIYTFWMLKDKLFAEATVILAPNWLCIFILLLDSLSQLHASFAHKWANLQFWLHFCRTGHCTLDRKNFT